MKVPLPPKEKAAELVEKFLNCIQGHFQIQINKEIAQDCALICTDEILDIKMINNIGRAGEILVTEGEYWVQVEQEIEGMENNDNKD